MQTDKPADVTEQPAVKRRQRVAWRKFAREVGSVVLGVLIALGIGEVADQVRWQMRAAHSNAAIDTELARAAGIFDERIMTQPCLNRRIEELDRIVRAARRNGILPDLVEIGRPPTRPLQTAAWGDAAGSGTLLHFSDERRSMLSINYPIITSYGDAIQQEQVLWATLRALEHAPGRVPDDLLSEATTTIARLRQASELNFVNARQIRDDILARKIAPNYFLILDRQGGRAEVAAGIRGRPICQPLLLNNAGAK